VAGRKKIAYDFHDYKKDGVPPGKLKEWAARAGWEKLANTRGPTWRKIPEALRENPTEARALALLAHNSSAIKRPIVEAGSRLLVASIPRNTPQRAGADLDRLSTIARISGVTSGSIRTTPSTPVCLVEHIPRR